MDYFRHHIRCFPIPFNERLKLEPNYEDETLVLPDRSCVGCLGLGTDATRPRPNPTSARNYLGRLNDLGQPATNSLITVRL